MKKSEEPMVEPNPGAYTSGMWFFGNEGFDFMFMLFKNKGENFFRANYRFRYHVDDKIFDSEDVKNWYSIVYKEGTTEDEITMGIHLSTKQVASAIGCEPEYVAIKGDTFEAMEKALKDKSWAHMKVLEPGTPEFEKYNPPKEKEAK